jgi:aspartate aminotransferase
MAAAQARLLGLGMDFGSPQVLTASLSTLAKTTKGSDILRIAAEIRALKATGRPLCNLTIGDFDSAQFSIPEPWRAGIGQALAAGRTNYPPPDGVPALRQAVCHLYARELGLDYPVESVVVASGARPLLYGVYRCLLDPGDVVIYPVPSWNNGYYAQLVGARAVELAAGRSENFFPLPEALDEHLGVARLVALNSPLNPTGTVISPDVLAALCERVVSENERRQRKGQKSLWLCYDQVYWQLTFGAARHVTPTALVPEVARYTVMVDAASKSYAATGLRVGWAVMPPVLAERMANILGHVGAWAPHAEQVALASFLADEGAQARYRDGMVAAVRQRLDGLANGFHALQAQGLPVEVIDPQGAIYLSVRIGKAGASNESIRKSLLEEAGFAVVPFQAFGQRGDTGWFRLSVGAVSVAEIAAAFPRLRELLVSWRGQEPPP